MKRRFVSFALAACMVAGMLTGCNGGTKNAETGSTTGTQQETQASGDTTAADGEVVKEAPMLQEMVTSGTIPALEERLPAEADVYVEEEYSPKDETPVYGGTMRTPNAGMWYFGPIAEEPLFRMLDDGVIDFLKTTREQMKKYRREIQMIFQDPYASLDPRMTVFDIISEPLRYNSKLSKREIEEAVDKIAEQVGLNKAYLRRYPHAFSGGQRQRIGIARSLILQPKVIVCDEAVSALDVSIQAQIINLLEELQEEYNLTYLFISHALSVVRHISDRVMVMYLGRMVELAETEKLFEHPMHPYTKALLSAAPKPDPDAVIDRIVLEGEVPNPANPPEGCHFHPRCRYKTERCMKEYPPLREYNGRWVACWNCEGCQDQEEEEKKES